MLIVIVLVLVGILIVLLLPAPLEIVPFVAAPALPAEGVLAPNDALRDPARIERIGEGRLNFPEDVTFDAEGRMYAGSRDATAAQAGASDTNARIERVTFHADGTHTVEEYVKLPGGGPLDLRFDAGGNLVVASWGQGLIRISPSRVVTVLVAEGQVIDGEPFGFADGVAIARDGKIYFTQGANAQFAYAAARNFIANQDSGRLLVYDPATETARTLVHDLSFGNGVVLAPDESYALVSDQLRYQIKRYWLAGEKAGTEEIFVNNLPGFPHNLFLDDAGVLWVALTQPRNTLGDSLRANPFLARQFAKFLLLMPNYGEAGRDPRDETVRGVGMVLALDLDGAPLLSLHNPPASLYTLSTAVYHDGYVYLGSIDGGPVVRYRLDERPT
jgi:hypothetical protein